MIISNINAALKIVEDSGICKDKIVKEYVSKINHSFGISKALSLKNYEPSLNKQIRNYHIDWKYILSKCKFNLTKEQMVDYNEKPEMNKIVISNSFLNYLNNSSPARNWTISTDTNEKEYNNTDGRILTSKKKQKIVSKKNYENDKELNKLGVSCGNDINYRITTLVINVKEIIINKFNGIKDDKKIDIEFFTNSLLLLKDCEEYNTVIQFILDMKSSDKLLNYNYFL